jgi:hypothetical protein
MVHTGPLTMFDPHQTIFFICDGSVVDIGIIRKSIKEVGSLGRIVGGNVFD